MIPEAENIWGIRQLQIPYQKSGIYGIAQKESETALLNQIGKPISRKTIAKGKQITLKVRYPITMQQVSSYGKNKNRLVTEAMITYQSSKKSVATVNKKGIIKAKKAGKAVITTKVK